MIDIIIPVLNEENILTQKREYYRSLQSRANIIFADGGSRDRTVQLAGAFGEVVSSAAGRGGQKNRGAAAAKSDILLFLHADTFLSDCALERIGQAVERGGAGGCLTMHIEDTHFMFRIWEGLVNFRARAFGVMDGDLGLFARRDVFEKLGGFDPLPYMEDILFSAKMRRAYRATVLTERIFVSSRKWHEHGFPSTFATYTLAYLQLWTGHLGENNKVNSHQHSCAPEAHENL